jgi:hypothetical protein
MSCDPQGLLIPGVSFILWLCTGVPPRSRNRLEISLEISTSLYRCCCRRILQATDSMSQWKMHSGQAERYDSSDRDLTMSPRSLQNAILSNCYMFKTIASQSVFYLSDIECSSKPWLQCARICKLRRQQNSMLHYYCLLGCIHAMLNVLVDPL